jgi:short subunit dehydrogenase-like uncharacterized protein
VSDRDLDVVVFGATGLTGRQVAAYLAERARETNLSWAPAARDAEKVRRLLGDAGIDVPEPIVADVNDATSLAAMASRAKVVLNLVGPYTLYGEPVIEACVAAGAHYVDLTGEMQFVRAMLERFDRPALDAGVKVVQTCGFESLPPDLCVLLAQETASARFDEDLAAADLEVSVKPPPGPPRPSDAISGGTLQSLVAVAEADDAAAVTDPALLVRDAAIAAAVRRISPITLVPRRGSRGAVIAPMTPAAFINPAVIHRSAELAASASGRPAAPFRYREGVRLGGHATSLPLRWGVAGALSATQAGLRGLTRASSRVRAPMAHALGRVLPGSGFGPAADRLEGWRWTMSVHAQTVGEHEVDVRIDADGHPGYLTTARMLGEAGILLAEDDATPSRAGCLTPATALGSAAAERLARAGVRFSIDATAVAAG